MSDGEGTAGSVARAAETADRNDWTFRPMASAKETKMKKPVPTGKGRLTIVTMSGETKLVTLPEYTDGKVRAKLGTILSWFKLNVTDCMRFWR